LDNVLILGGGFAGLAAARRLGKAGVRSTILEGSPRTGGLAGCVTVGGVTVEKFYHHFKPEDRDVVALIEEMGLGGDLRWADTRMGFYIDGRFHAFSTPLDLLRFSPLPFADRVRFALGTLRAKRIDGKTLDGLNAEEWALSNWNRNIYERMLKPMLLNKFGIPPAEISAGFLQGRIKGLSSAKSDVRKGEKLSILRNGLDNLARRVEEDIRGTTDIRVSTPVERIESTGGGFRVWSGRDCFEAATVINTLPLNVFEAIPRNFEFESGIAHQSVVCAVFAVREKLTPIYWLNVLDPDITFRVLVNQSRIDDYPHTIIYCGNYLKGGHPLFAKPTEEILGLYERDLRKMFGKVTVIDRQLSRTRSATPVFDKNFAPKLARLDSAVPGMIFAGHVKVYPYSRTVSNVLRTGYEAADRALAILREPKREAACPR
jgi:protoporphyrinogen oxidase